MQDLAANLQFEDAQVLKEKITILENYQSKSTIVNPKISDVEVYSIVSDESYAYVNFLQLSYGAIIRAHTMEIKRNFKKVMLNYWNWQSQS